MRRLVLLFTLVLLTCAPAANGHESQFAGADWKVTSASEQDDGAIYTTFELWIGCSNSDVAAGSISFSRRQADGSYQQVNGIYYRTAPNRRVTKSIDLPPGDYQAVWEVAGCAYEGERPAGDTGLHSDYRRKVDPGTFTISCPPPSARPIGGYPLVPVAGCRAENTTQPAPPDEPCRASSSRGLSGYPLIPCDPPPSRTASRGRVGQRVVCSVDRCTGTITLRTARKVEVSCKAGHGFPIVPVCKGFATRRRVITLGRARFDIAAGSAKVVKVRLKRRYLRYLRSVRRLKVRMIVSARSGEERLRSENTFTLRSR